jgi:lipopolysaccharide assembly LptE-like protein
VRMNVRNVLTVVRAAALLIMTSVAMSGCGYSLAGRGSYLPAYIKTIGVPQFVNNTPVFEIENKITEKVRAELIGRGKYTIRPDRVGVDAVLLGQIMGVSIVPAAVNQQQQATAYAVSLVVNVEFRDVKTDKALWANPAMVYTEQFPVTTTTGAAGAPDANTFLGQNVNAFDRLSSEFARAVVSAILESF